VVVTADFGIRNCALVKNSFDNGGISDVSIFSSLIASILAQSVFEVFDLASAFIRQCLMWCVTLRDAGGEINIWKHLQQDKGY